MQINDNKILVVGMDHPNEHYSFVLNVKDLEEQSWKVKAPAMIMHAGHLNCALALKKKKEVFAISGREQVGKEKKSLTGVCELLKVKKKQWKQISDIPVAVQRASAVFVKKNKSLYVFGGRNEDDEVLDVVQKLKVKKDKWKALKIKMPMAAEWTSAVYFKKQN